MIRSVCVVMLTWNALEDSRHCLRSLEATEYGDLRIVVVDNGSHTNEAAALQSEFPRIEAIRLESNHGFARGVNVGAFRALQAGCDAILLLNNDATVPAGSRMLERLVAELNAESTLAAAGPVLVDPGEPLVVQNAGLALSLFFPVPRHIDRGLKFPILAEARQRLDFLSGGCVLIRSDVFARLGGLDPDCFLYGDDADFALRLRAAGYSSRVVRSEYIIHDKGKGIGAWSARYVYAAIRGHLIFLSKHLSWYHWPSAALTMVAASAGLVLIGTRRGHAGTLGAAVRAWRDFVAGRWGGYDGTWPKDEAPRDVRALALQSRR